MLLLLLLLCCVSPAMGSKFNKNKLFPEYGINFRYIGEIKNGLDRVSVVTLVPLPHFKDIHISPLKFHNCSMDMDLDSAISKEHSRLQIVVSEWGLGTLAISAVTGLITLTVESIGSYL